MQNVPIDEAEAKRVLKKYTNVIPNGNLPEWAGTEEYFCDLIKSKKHSAPGPDGLPYGAYKVNETIMKNMYLLYAFWIKGSLLPKHSNIAYLWLLPKGDNPSPCRAPADMRPLSGSNTDAKILASMLGSVVEPTICKWAVPWQRGFLKDRHLLNNVLEVDAYALKCSLLSDDDTAILLLDFAAAFPSISRSFIFLSLHYAGFPKEIIRAIESMYDDNIHYIKFGGVCKKSFTARSGVRQGCPLSSTLFVISTDSINIMLKKKLPKDLLATYADDIAIVMTSMRQTLHRLPAVFTKIESVARLKLNIRKCKLIPVGRVRPLPLNGMSIVLPPTGAPLTLSWLLST